MSEERGTKKDVQKLEYTRVYRNYLQKIPNVYNKRSMHRRNINPLILMKNLKTTHLVLQKNCHEANISVL